MNLSYNTYTKMDYPVKFWKTKEINDSNELETLVKAYPYSNFTFKDGYRSSNNTAELTSLILDFDNDNKDYLISMKETANKLKQKRIKSFLIETKSSGKEKRGIVAERFRVIIPITKEIPISRENREEYAKAIENFAEELELLDYLDKGALKDIARMYKQSPKSAKSIAINGNNEIDFNVYLTKAKNQLIEEEKQRQNELNSLEKNIDIYIYSDAGDMESFTGLTYANLDKILSLDFKSLINYFEGIEKEYKEGSYQMVKTDSAKYSLLKNGEVIHDFKSGKTYNKVNYLYEKLNVKDLMSLARALQDITGERYMKVNEKLVSSAIIEAVNNATNLKEFNEIVKDKCNVKFCKVDLKANIVKIADIEVETDTKAILKRINHNRKVKKLNYISDNLSTLKETSLYNEFIDEVGKEEPEDYNEAIKWVENNPYDDEKFEEWIKENYSSEKIKEFVKEQEEQSAKQKQQQQEQNESWHIKR